MPELHDYLDDEARRVRSDPGALGAVKDRAERRHRTRRLATGALALALAAGGIGVTYAAFDVGGRARPGTEPVPGPSPTQGDPAIEGLILSNDSATEGAADFAAALLGGRGIVPDLLEPAGGSLETTTIHCHPTREDDALWLRDRFFPGAELRPRIEADSVLVRIGNDFVSRNADLFDQFMTVRSFMTRRAEGSGAEAFLTPDAADRFADVTSGLSLYSYVRGGTFQIRGIHAADDGTAVADVLVLTSEGGNLVASERLTVGDVDPGDRRAEIIDASLAGPSDPMLEQIRIFVREFLRSRRHASGAGAFLGQDARQAYAAHEDGLDLLGYAAADDLIGARIVGLDKQSADRTLVRVRFTLPGREVFETLTVERQGQTLLVIADAERDDGSP